ncbi:MAG: hypothetical protein RJA44_2755 [Pseudomonadota bacterium]|jgi:DedD protein
MGLISFLQSKRQARQRSAAVPTDLSELERLRTSARRRLIGAAVLVVAAVIGLPMLLDTQPRPLPPQLAIDIGHHEAANAAPAANAALPAQPDPAPAQTPPAAPPAPQAPPVQSEAARVQALLEDRQAPARARPASETASRFVVQVGAFEQASAAREMRARVEKLGLRTYAQEVDSSSGGKRIRVRIGPFTSRDEADKVAARVRANGMTPSVLAL